MNPEVDGERELPPIVEVEAPYAYIGGMALDNLGATSDLPFSNNTIDLIERIRLTCPEVEPRVEQMECLDALAETRLNGGATALVQMATGLGKTNVMAADAKRFLEEHPGSRVLFLCHQNRILDQARERFERIIGPDATYGTFTGEEQDYHKVSCLFASFQVMREWREAFFPDEFDYIVIDESHHAKASTYEPTLRYFEPQFMAGFTGTPDRRDLKDIREIFGPEIYQKPLDEAIAEGLLTPVEYRVVIDEIAALQVLHDIRGAKHNIKQLNRTIFAPMRDDEVARICIEDAKDLNGPVRRLVFCPSIEHTEEFAQYFPNAAPIHTKLPAWEIKRYLEQFKAGELETLLVVDMFNEGIDVPEVNQVVFMRQTDSKTVFLQQLGRGLRKLPGKELVQVRDFVANCERLTMLDEFWGDVFASSGDPEHKQITRIDVGSVNFTELQREILDILSDIETTGRGINQREAVTYYKNLCEEAGRIAGISDIKEAYYDGKGPATKRLLRPFNGSLMKLREAACIKIEAKLPIAGTWDDWAAADSIEIYKTLSGDEPLSVTRLAAVLAQRKDVPSLTRFLQDFEGKITNLKEAAGYKSKNEWQGWNAEKCLAVYRRLSEGNLLTAEELKAKLAEDPDLPPFYVLLIPFDRKLGNLHEAAGHKNRLMHRSDWTETDSIRVYNELADGEILSSSEFTRRLQARKDLPGPHTVLEPFGGKIRALQQKVNETVKHPDWSNWTEEDSVRIYKELSGDTPLSGPELAEKLAERKDTPSISTFLTPFEGRITDLRLKAGFNVVKKEGSRYVWIAADSIRVYQELSGEVPIGSIELREILSKRDDLPGRNVFLRDFSGSIVELRKAAGYDAG